MLKLLHSRNSSEEYQSKTEIQFKKEFYEFLDTIELKEK
jgi:hypothetical protein